MYSSCYSTGFTQRKLRYSVVCWKPHSSLTCKRQESHFYVDRRDNWYPEGSLRFSLGPMHWEDLAKTMWNFSPWRLLRPSRIGRITSNSMTCFEATQISHLLSVNVYMPLVTRKSWINFLPCQHEHSLCYECVTIDVPSVSKRFPEIITSYSVIIYAQVILWCVVCFFDEGTKIGRKIVTCTAQFYVYVSN